MSLTGKPQGIDNKRQRDPQAITGKQANKEGLETTISRDTAKMQYEQFECPNNKNRDLIAAGDIGAANSQANGMQGPLGETIL